jgi:hypothetical protein
MKTVISNDPAPIGERCFLCEETLTPPWFKTGKISHAYSLPRPFLRGFRGNASTTTNQPEDRKRQHSSDGVGVTMKTLAWLALTATVVLRP